MAGLPIKEAFAGTPVVGAILAVRTFHLGDDGALLPITQDHSHVWADGENTAVCSMVWSAHPGVPSPTPGCVCGFYSYNNPDRVDRTGHYGHPGPILAVVEVYGTVVAGEYGYMSSHARIVGVHLPFPYRKLRAAVTARYPSVTVHRSVAGLLAAYPLTDPAGLGVEPGPLPVVPDDVTVPGVVTNGGVWKRARAWLAPGRVFPRTVTLRALLACHAGPYTDVCEWETPGWWMRMFTAADGTVMVVAAERSVDEMSKQWKYTQATVAFVFDWFGSVSVYERESPNQEGWSQAVVAIPCTEAAALLGDLPRPTPTTN